MDKITFEQFLQTYNFRYVSENSKEEFNSQIVRIYPPTDQMERHRWFELGIYDFGEDEYKLDIAKQCLSKEILNSYVEFFCLTEDLDELVVYLTNNKRRD